MPYICLLPPDGLLLFRSAAIACGDASMEAVRLDPLNFRAASISSCGDRSSIETH